MTEIAYEAKTDFDLVRDQVVGLLAIEDDQEFTAGSQAFIDQRIRALEGNTPHRELISPMTIKHSGYIPTYTEVRSWAGGRAFLMDDPVIYTELLNTMRDHYKNSAWQQPEVYRQLIFYSVQYATAKYFNGVYGDENTQTRRLQKLASNDVFAGDSSSSIAEFKDTALCTERATVANNMLSMLGVATEFILADLEIDNKPPESHAFLVVENAKGNKNLYDPTHPQIVHKDGVVTSINPFIIPGAEKLFTGEAVEGVHVDASIKPDNSRSETALHYKYVPGVNLYASQNFADTTTSSW